MVVHPSRAKVISTGRIGKVLIFDETYRLLSYKLAFADGKDPEFDWFSKDAVDVVPDPATDPNRRITGIVNRVETSGTNNHWQLTALGDTNGSGAIIVDCARPVGEGVYGKVFRARYAAGRKSDWPLVAKVSNTFLSRGQPLLRSHLKVIRMSTPRSFVKSERVSSMSPSYVNASTRTLVPKVPLIGRFFLAEIQIHQP